MSFETDLAIDTITGLSPYQLELIVVNQGVLFRGSMDGGSVQARFLEGNNQIRIFSGDSNFINGNNRQDTIYLNNAGGRILGGADEDFIYIKSGFYSSINGNKGRDIITNVGANLDLVRGGSEDDQITSRAGSMNAYGDLGKDLFIGYTGGFMTIKDYQPGHDCIAVAETTGISRSRNIENYLVSEVDQGLLISSDTGIGVMLLEGASSI